MNRKKNKKKDEQLGMPIGTASNRLKKSIIMMLLKQQNLNFCFQCGAEIETEKELSIEHKVPYLDSNDPVSLFFDLNNIAFSHLKCNVDAGRDTRKRNCGTTAGYKRGCRCESCVLAMRECWNKHDKKRRKDDVKEQIPSLVKQGISYREIENLIGISRQSICRYMKKYLRSQGLHDEDAGLSRQR